MRLFFALWPPAQTARALAAWAREVQQGAGGRATAEEAIHLTLAFLGEADADRATAAARRVRGEIFELPIDTCRYWPHNNIVWVGSRAMSNALKNLVGSLHRTLRGEAFVLEERPFAAHVTLIRKASPPEALPELPSVAWPVTELVLVRSTPAAAGSRYEILERFPLGAEH